MDKIASLSPAKCILLAAAFASSSNTDSLRRLLSAHPELFNLELTCRILLSCLPEIVDPADYVPLLTEAVNGNTSHDDHDDTPIDTSSVDELSDTRAKSRLRKLRLLHLKHPSVPGEATDDPLTLFLIHRAHKIDSDTGMFPLVPQLVAPFLDRSEYLRDWYIGAVVPFLRSEYEYFPPEYSSHNLEAFEQLDGNTGVQALLSKTKQHDAQGEATADTVGRDFRGILAPWILAGQKLRGKKRKRGSADGFVQESTPEADLGSSETAEWQAANEWLVSTAMDNFPLAVNIFEGWGGPTDVDLGVSEELYPQYQPDQRRIEALQRAHCRTAFASIYAVEQDTPETIDGAHSLLARLAELLGFQPPPDLATSVHMLPKIERNTQRLKETLMAYIQSEALLSPDNPLTAPTLESFSLLQMFVYSAYLLASLGQALSVAKVAKLRFWSEDDEQLRFVQRIMHGLAHGQNRAESQWEYARDTMLWLWDWAIGDLDVPDDGYGVFGRVKRSALEMEILKAACIGGQYSLVARTYLDKEDARLHLAKEEVEKVIVNLALHYYDNASNGNKTRGGVKKALDILNAFRSHFPDSSSFKRCSCLINATHALSFYSLRLRPGVPFQPVSIRESDDPVGLIEKVLEQNENSYTKLDDLIDISQNLVKASSEAEQDNQPQAMKLPEDEESFKLFTAERRVIGMAIDAALNADDFETAYSYVVNRLPPPPANQSHPSSAADDISWCAALRAGRHRTLTVAQASTAGANSTTSPQVRRLEQRMELLSHALQLAPAQNLPEVLSTWRRVEEELLSLIAQEAAAEREFDDDADKGQVRGAVPGSFAPASASEMQQGLLVQPRRKELGRGAVEEAPMGLFDVARGAAAAFGRSTSGSYAARGGKTASRAVSGESAGYVAAGGDDAEGRQRKRDMVANAVTGGLASGLGWVLGAKPVAHDEQP